MKYPVLSLAVAALLWGGAVSLPCQAQTAVKHAAQTSQWDDTSAARWSADFTMVDIPSKVDSRPQKAYLYQATEPGRPLIVSLHTWSGDYRQADPLAAEAKARNYNYIHPDFQGANTRPEAMGSERVVKNLQEAIEYAVRATGADAKEVHVIGVGRRHGDAAGIHERDLSREVVLGMGAHIRPGGVVLGVESAWQQVCRAH